MGQGYSLTTLSAGAAGIDAPELADLTYERSLGNARFMKSIRARHKDGLVVAKVVMKPYQSLRLDKYVRILIEERAVIADVPNALPYHRILETGANGYLVRQYVHSSLYDRMSTRPFLEDIEKRWLSFQLLCAVRDCHARNLFHGDIKTENCLVTSWNWLYLCDFSSSFKPTYLPSDNPADYSFYFDTSGRRTCYLAPERFLDPSDHADGGVTWAMDIFSVGCVIAELFLETPIFSLSQLFRYKNKDFDPAHTVLSRIEDVDIREMVVHMISRDPEDRYSAEEYLNFWRQKSFPEYFYSFLHQYMFLITDPSSGRAPMTAGTDNLGEADERIDRVYLDFDKIAYFLGYEDSRTSSTGGNGTRALRKLFPLRVDIPDNQHDATPTLSRTVDDGSLIFLQLVVSSLRNTARATARIRACELLLAFAERLTDEAKLDRVLPYLMFLLEKETSVMVKVAALRTVTQLLALISVVSPSNANIFPDYITKRLTLAELGSPVEPGAKKRIRASPIVRATYASCLATLATTSSRYLNLVQGLKADGSLPTNDPEAEDALLSYSRYQNLYDTARVLLIQHFEAETKALLQDTDASVRRAFLGSIGPLCVFFGSEKASDVLLTQLNTYLNDRDWMLKCTFFETIVGVATFVGGPTFEEFILPLMIQAMTDPEEFVVERVLRSFAAIAVLGLFQRARIWELVDVVARFTMHPNVWIREAAAQFITSSSRYLSIADKHSVIIPLIRVYLRSLPADLSELAILECLKRPLPRLVLDMASLWAAKAQKGLFWKQIQRQRAFSFGGDDTIPIISGKDLGPNALTKVQRNDEDEGWLSRLRNAGMEAEDDVKLLALREYIWRVAQRRGQDESTTKTPTLNGIVMLKNLNITPQTVLFNEDVAAYQEIEAMRKQRSETPKTIAEAMLDASTTVDDALTKRKGSNIDRILQQEGLAPRSTPLSPTDTPPIGRMSPIIGSPPKDSIISHGVRNASPGGEDAADLDRVMSQGEHRHALRHRESAMSLLGRGDTRSKALAELGTSPANAIGSIDGTFNRDVSKRRVSNHSRSKSPLHKEEPTTQEGYAIPHTYTGGDPTVLRLLDSFYIENYPTEYIDFGPQIAPPKRRRPVKRSATQPEASPWKPEGILVAALGEHTGSVNRVAVSADHLFFITGSDDGSVKIWDSARLERNIAHRSRQSHHHAADSRVTSLCFVENTHTFVSTATDGSVHAVRVHIEEAQGDRGMLRYTRLKLVREYHLQPGQYAVWCEHFKADDGSSTLMLATNDSHIIAIDLRSMKVLYDLHNPLNHGTPTCFCIDRKHHWVLAGTSHGILDLWDLRFQLRVRAWKFAAGAPIHRLCLVPLAHGPKKNRICIAGGTGQPEVTVWDLEKGQCREVFRADDGESREGQKTNYKLMEIDDEKSGGMLERFAGAVEPATGSRSASADRSVMALATGLHVPEDGQEARLYFMLCAGPDWRVRFWDTARPEDSCIVSGLDDEKPSYTTERKALDVSVTQEHLKKREDAGLASSAQNGTPRKGTARSGSRGLVSLQTQNLLRSHLDQIMDVALLERPYGMAVSVDRAGMIYVFA